MKKTILICDDEEWVCSLLQDYLEGEGYGVVTANDLESARVILKDVTLPDLLIQDVMLPDGNGMDFLVELRSAPHTKSLPVIVVTAHKTETKDRISGFDLGADDYMVKPFDLKELKSRIERILNRVEVTQKEPSQKDESPSEKEDSSPPLTEPPVETIESRPSLMSRFFRMLLFPFDAIQENDGKDWSLSILSLNLFSIGLAAQWGILKQSFYEGFQVYAIIISVVLGLVGLLSGVGLLVSKIMKQKTNFGLWFNTVSLGFIPMSISSLLGILFVLLAKGGFGQFTAGPFLLFPQQSSSSMFGFWLRHFDFFEFWAVALIALSLSTHLKAGQISTIARFLMGWTILILLGGVLR